MRHFVNCRNSLEESKRNIYSSYCRIMIIRMYLCLCLSPVIRPNGERYHSGEWLQHYCYYAAIVYVYRRQKHHRFSVEVSINSS